MNKACLKISGKSSHTSQPHWPGHGDTHLSSQDSGREKQVDFCEFKATLGYTRLTLSKRETAHLCKGDPSTREVETGVTCLGGEECKGEETNSVECGV